MVRDLTPDPPPELVVGLATGDDAAVWRIGRGRALVFTADFITPVVDDARTWGRIAATNAVSDVYAMGGRPLLALNLVAWNSEELSNDLLAEVLAGGEDAARACGFVVGGGHTVDDPEPKYGMAVVGEVNPGRMLTNAGLRPGNALVLTKPLGTGVISTAIKRAEARPEVVDRAVAEMTRSNEAAAAAAMRHGATAATDVTGFGLLGHGLRMAQESGVDLEVSVGEVPIIEGARELAVLGSVPGGTQRNLDWVSPHLDIGDASESSVTLLADAQTSGGLLLGMVSHDAGLAVVTELRHSGHEAAVIGVVTEGSGRIRLPALTGGPRSRSVEEVGLLSGYLGVQGLEGEPHGQAGADHRVGVAGDVVGNVDRVAGGLGQQLRLAGPVHGHERARGRVHRRAHGEQAVVLEDGGLAFAQRGRDALALVELHHHAAVAVEDHVVVVEGAGVLGQRPQRPSPAPRTTCRASSGYGPQPPRRGGPHGSGSGWRRPPRSIARPHRRRCCRRSPP